MPGCRTRKANLLGQAWAVENVGVLSSCHVTVCTAKQCRQHLMQPGQDSCLKLGSDLSHCADGLILAHLLVVLHKGQQELAAAFRVLTLLHNGWCHLLDALRFDTPTTCTGNMKYVRSSASLNSQDLLDLLGGSICGMHILYSSRTGCGHMVKALSYGWPALMRMALLLNVLKSHSLCNVPRAHSEGTLLY